MNNIQHRNDTLVRCADEIVASQKDFFEGTGHLRPLTIKQIADRLNLNESTVSRAIHGKYIQHSKGVLPMKSLFTGKIGTDNDEQTSTDAAKKLIKQMICEEDKLNPLSDEKIVSALKDMSLNLSRRCVAKYREQMGIPNGYIRRQNHFR